MTPTASLYETLGGKAAIGAVVDDFYRRVLADPTLAPRFAQTEMDKQRKHLAAFMALALGGPDEYAGRSMEKAHAGLNITRAEFGAVAGHLVQTLRALGVPQPHIDSVIGRVAGLEGGIVGK